MISAPGASDGYVTDIAYVDHFVPECAPASLALAAALAGVAPPDIGGAFAYLDVGCGNGFTAALVAAANPHAQVWGNDFNPAHIRTARARADAAALTNATFVEASFADLLDRPLPAFDFVAVHGIWSWVDAANRDRVVRLLDRCVAPGGLVAVSYNCHPGWDALLPLRRLLIDAAGSGGDGAARIERALAAARRLRDAGADYFRHNPAASRALDGLEGLDRGYLVHEYLNDHWSLFHPGEVFDAVAGAGLRYVGQARPIDDIDDAWLTGQQRKLVDEAPAPAAAQALRDLVLDRRFRRDLFVRDAGPARAETAAAWFADRRFVLARPRASCAPTSVRRAEAAGLALPLAEPVLDALAAGAATTEALAARLGETPGQVRATLAGLAAMCLVFPTLDAKGDAARRISTDRFNAAALAAARTARPAAALASPLTGSGVVLPPVQQMLLDAYRSGVAFDVAADDDPATAFRDRSLPALAMLGIV